MVASPIVAVSYIWGLLTPVWDIVLLKPTAAVAVPAILGLIDWIGYSLASTSAPSELLEGGSPTS